MTQLTLKNLTHSYADKAVLTDINYSMQSGSLHSILGCSGCGKTTLLRLIAGFEPLQQGAIWFDDQLMADKKYCTPPEKRHVGIVFQDYALFPHLTVYNNLIFGLSAKNRKRHQWVLEAAQRLGLSSLLKRYPYQLSGGEQQRVALLRSLAPEPQILLLDEPFSGLNPQLRHQAREEVLTFIQQTGITTLLVTHDPEEACYLSDQLLILNQGAIVQQGAPLEIMQNPATAFVAGFFKRAI